ncbi:MAG: response regulator transcription factor [Chloroflexota bacterium]
MLIVAAAPALRAGLRALLEGDGLQVAGELPSLSALRGAPPADVLLLADADQLADAERVLPEHARLAIVALAEEPRAAAQLRGLPLAGWGLLPPDAGPEELAAAVRAAAGGLVALAPSLAARLLSRPPALEQPAGEATEQLTAREREVLDLVSQGLSNKLIARQLQISEHTVKFHLSSIFAKLGAVSRTDAVNRAARQGLIAL